MIVAISGTPGTGKTEVARVLAKKLGWKLIYLNKLAEEKDLYVGWDIKRKCKIVDIAGLRREVRKLKGNFVIESHYAHDMPADLIVILRANPREIRARLGKRGWTAAKIEENVEAEIMEVCRDEAILQHGRKVVEVDTTRKSAESAALAIVHFLNARKPSVS